MIPALLICIPLVAGVLSFILKNEKSVRTVSVLAALAVMGVSIYGLTLPADSSCLAFKAEWMSTIGSSFHIQLDAMGQILCLLTALSFPIIFLSIWNSPFKNANRFFGLMLLGQAGLMGVFLAMDALLFYFFWELALIPMYFLASIWGGENRIKVAFKFFIYTFLGSLLMLIGILYVQSQTADKSFSYEAFRTVQLARDTESWMFWLFFVAFAIKLPIWPLHTWQPDAYEQSPTAVTMVLSGVMVKMGLLGIIRWLIPTMPNASYAWGDVVMTMSVIGIIYASLIAIRSDNIKRLIAYSSIAHIGLMCMAIFSLDESGWQGALLQMFNHGINIIGLWIMVEIIERQFGTRKLSELGGIAAKAPAMAIFFVIIALANIALPLTNGFVGEFLMFNSLLVARTNPVYAILFTVFAGIAIILAAIYTLNMIRKIFYGELNERTANAQDLNLTQKLVLSGVVIIIFWLGLYPQSLLQITEAFSLQHLEVFSKIR